jgi:sugar lactone lactonase YvrE
LALDANDNLFIADKADTSVGAFVQVLPKTSGTVLGVAVTANQVFNVAGKNAGASLGDGAAATSAVLSKPYSIAVDSAGNLFIADFNNNRIRVVAQSNLTRIGVAMTTGNIYTAVGTGTPAFSGDGGSPSAAEIDSPNGVALNSSGYLYVADQGNSRIRRATP